MAGLKLKAAVSGQAHKGDESDWIGLICDEMCDVHVREITNSPVQTKNVSIFSVDVLFVSISLLDCSGRACGGLLIRINSTPFVWSV